MIVTYKDLTKILTDRATSGRIENLGGSAVYQQVDQILTTGGSITTNDVPPVVRSYAYYQDKLTDIYGKYGLTYESIKILASIDFTNYACCEWSIEDGC